MAACHASCVPSRSHGSPQEWLWTTHLSFRNSNNTAFEFCMPSFCLLTKYLSSLKPSLDSHSSFYSITKLNSQLLPVRESLVLLPNMSSVAFMGAVSLASIVSTFPVEEKMRTDWRFLPGWLFGKLKLMLLTHLWRRYR